MKKNTPTSVAGHMALISEMLHAIITIDAFERKLQSNQEKIWNIEHGQHKLMPTYFANLKKSYEEANHVFKLRILQEQGIYDRAFIRIMALTFRSRYDLNVPTLSDIPALPMIEHDDDMESLQHQRICGAH